MDMIKSAKKRAPKRPQKEDLTTYKEFKNLISESLSPADKRS